MHRLNRNVLLILLPLGIQNTGQLYVKLYLNTYFRATSTREMKIVQSAEMKLSWRVTRVDNYVYIGIYWYVVPRW